MLEPQRSCAWRYIDTGRKSLVVQGANGPKAYEFAHMREVDMESRTTKEGRLETLVRRLRVRASRENGSQAIRCLRVGFSHGRYYVHCGEESIVNSTRGQHAWVPAQPRTIIALQKALARF